MRLGAMRGHASPYAVALRELLSHRHDAEACRQEARWLVDEVRTRHRLSPASVAWPAPAVQVLLSLARRAARDEPLSYVIGHQPFGPLSLLTRPPILIPRCETEAWTYRLLSLVRARWAADRHRPRRILDLCTGSGCIAVALAHGLQEYVVDVVGMDSDEHAVELACENAQRHDLKRITMVHGDLWDDACVSRLGAFDLVTCNPPYIAEASWAGLDASVRDHESYAALVGAAGDGYAYYRRLRSLSLWTASPMAPSLVMEVGAGQAGRVADLFAPWPTDVWKDDAGWDRVVAVTWPSSSSSRRSEAGTP